MYTLYWCPRTASLAPELLLAEAELPYDKVLIDIKKGEHRHPSYLAINPAGFVPALEMPGGEIQSETAAIMLSLCERHDLALAPGPDDPKRTAFLHYMIFFAGMIQPTYKRNYFPERFSTDGEAVAPGIKARSIEMQEQHWDLVEQRLTASGTTFLLGSSCSAADLYLAMLVTWHPDEADLLGGRPALARCFEAVTARPTVQRVMTEHRYLPG